jgi:hypothetical protein
MRCTYTETEVVIPDAAWLDYLAGDICAFSVDDTGAVMRPPAYDERTYFLKSYLAASCWRPSLPSPSPLTVGGPVWADLGGAVSVP